MNKSRNTHPQEPLIPIPLADMSIGILMIGSASQIGQGGISEFLQAPERWWVPDMSKFQCKWVNQEILTLMNPSSLPPSPTCRLGYGWRNQRLGLGLSKSIWLPQRVQRMGCHYAIKVEFMRTSFQNLAKDIRLFTISPCFRLVVTQE